MELSEEQKKKALEATHETKRVHGVDAFPVETVTEPSELQSPTRSPGSGDWQGAPPQWPEPPNDDGPKPGGSSAARADAPTSADPNIFEQALAELKEAEPASTDKTHDINR